MNFIFIVFSLDFALYKFFFLFSSALFIMNKYFLFCIIESLDRPN